MDNWTIALIILWMVLAVANIVGIWVSLPVLNATFGFLNMTIVVSLFVLLMDDFKTKKAQKKAQKENEL